MKEDMRQFETRLNRLELQNRRLKSVVLVVVLLAGMLLLMGQAKKDAGAPDAGIQGDCAVENKSCSDALQNGCGEIRANKFVLVDIDGTVRGEMKVVEGIPNLVFRGTDGKPMWTAFSENEQDNSGPDSLTKDTAKSTPPPAPKK